MSWQRCTAPLTPLPEIYPPPRHRPGKAAGEFGVCAPPPWRTPRSPSRRDGGRETSHRHHGRGPSPEGPRHSPTRNAARQGPQPASPWYCRSRSTSRKGSAEPRRPAEAAGDTISSSVAAPGPDSGGSGPGQTERRLQLLRAGSWATLIGHAARARPCLAPAAGRE